MSKLVQRVKRFFHSEHGFTLIELLVVVAILGILAAIAIPNVGMFIGRGKTEAASVELHDVTTSVLALMADAKIGEITSIPAGGADFGDDDGLPATAPKEITITVNTVVYNVSDYIAGGVDKVHGAYTVFPNGTVVQDSYW